VNRLYTKDDEQGQFGLGDEMKRSAARKRKYDHFCSLKSHKALKTANLRHKIPFWDELLQRIRKTSEFGKKAAFLQSS